MKRANCPETRPTIGLFLMQCDMNKNLDTCCHHHTILGAARDPDILALQVKAAWQKRQAENNKNAGFKARVAQGIHCNLAPISMVLLRFFVKVVHDFQTP